MLGGYLLTVITFGIYMFWFLTNLVRFNVTHYVIRRARQRAGLSAHC